MVEHLQPCVAGQDLGMQLVKQFGLNDTGLGPVRSLSFECRFDELVTVHVEYLVTPQSAGEIATILQEYHLVPHGDIASEILEPFA